MPRFREKPVIIHAMQIPPLSDFNYRDKIARWIEKNKESRNVVPNSDGSYLIHTLEGVIKGDVGDWIIRGIQGELYPCKPDIFEETYDLVGP